MPWVIFKFIFFRNARALWWSERWRFTWTPNYWNIRFSAFSVVESLIGCRFFGMEKSLFRRANFSRRLWVNHWVKTAALHATGTLFLINLDWLIDGSDADQVVVFHFLDSLLARQVVAKDFRRAAFG